ncbi:MAG: glycosyltransferase [Alphaproteobacteria bacterium]|nr:glycosyltransferase [Alphaproteobacteria bacterium]MBV9372939.1 glycosyltransferase [Alphaproteobacteria bacterium]MBV9900942.1 glycosyltransferase [Alphaproteobacteria bacterium]
MDPGGVSPGWQPERLAFLLPNMGGGGAERVALNLIRDFVGRGYEVDLVLVRAGGELLAMLPPEVRVVDLGAHRLVAAIRPLARYLRERRPHALQARMWPLTVVAILSRLLARVPTRIVVSDHAPLSLQYAGQRRTLRLLKATVRLFYPKADARVVVSSGSADDLAALGGIARPSIHVLHNPVPDPGPPVRDPAIDALWGEADGRLVTAGTLKPEKNHLLLIRAFALLRRHGRAARLMILGDGAMMPALRAEAARLGIAEDVLLPGFVANPSAYLASADLFVLSSDFEGFGNVLIEAMRLGLGIVSTDCPHGPAEILDGGRFGRLVPCGDPAALAEGMEAALAQPADGPALRRRAEALSGSGTFDAWLALMLGRPLAADEVSRQGPRGRSAD